MKGVLWGWLLVVFTTASLVVHADPVSPMPRFTFAGNLDFAVTGGSLRSQPNSGNSCALNPSSSATLSGIPSGSTIRAAYLYWAGSGPTADLNVTFNGLSTSADRSFTENYTIGATSVDFFGGFADVTSRVSGNGVFSVADLTVTNTDLGGGANYCSLSAVLSGWGLIVVYENNSEPLRVINLFDGLQAFRGSQIVLNPSNFVIPTAPINGRIGILSWEGDVENSAPFNGVAENILFNGASSPAVNLTDALNPLNNQFNSTVNVTGSSNAYGVDLDAYDISAFLTAGDTGAQTVYASGGDLVLLSAQVISVTNTAAVDLSLSKSHVGDFTAGGLHEFALTVTNNGPSDTSGVIQITDNLPAALSYSGFSSADANWSCNAVDQDVTCAHPGSLAAGVSLSPVTLSVAVAADAPAALTNSAVVSGADFDPILTNNTADDSVTVILPDLANSTKAVVDLNGFPLNAGDLLRFTVTLTESNGVSTTAQITDVLDGLLTGLTVIDAAGGADNSSPGTLQIDNVTVPAGGSVEVVFTAALAGSAVSGDVVSNSASISYPGDGGVPLVVASADLTVGASPAASGIKNLYLGEIDGSQNAPVIPLLLTRTPLIAPSAPARVRIRRQDNDRLWQLNPALQAPLTLQGDPLPVNLLLRRSGNTSARNIRVTVAYQTGAVSTFIGCFDSTLASTGANGLSNTVTRLFNFPVQASDSACNALPGGPLTIPAGARLTVAVDNQVGGTGNGQAIFVYPFDTGNISRLELPAQTVINVDSVDYFDAAYPGGSAASSFVPGQTLYMRATVSDPFGSFDIGGVSYAVTNASANPAGAGVMAQVQDSGAATAIYEVPVAIPLSGPTGNWGVTITADEGTEGTVSHVVQSTFVVQGSDMLLEKTVEVVTDSISATNPKAIPDAIVEYVIRVANRNALPAANVVLEDTLPADLRIFFGTPANPFVFIDGSPASGLSFTFSGLGDNTDDIRFSNDGGATFVTPVVDAQGFDATVPKINFVELTPQGSLLGASGGSEPGFEIRFRMRVE
ncbi:MAG: DUF3344 domain-containing protein [Pseudomonadota bacterium]